jgi:metalloendopeptidase OMA1, mitochondrial
MQEAEAGAQSSWFSKLADADFVNTHPASAKRIKNMEKWLPEALAIRAASPACARGLEEHYSRFRDGVRLAGW